MLITFTLQTVFSSLYAQGGGRSMANTVVAFICKHHEYVILVFCPPFILLVLFYVAFAVRFVVHKFIALYNVATDRLLPTSWSVSMCPSNANQR